MSFSNVSWLHLKSFPGPHHHIVNSDVGTDGRPLVEAVPHAGEHVRLDDGHDVREPHDVHVREEHVVAQVEHDPHARALEPHHIREPALREAGILEQNVVVPAPPNKSVNREVTG